MAEQQETKGGIKQEEVRDYIKSAVNKLGPKFSKDEKKEHAKLLVKIFEQGLPPKEAMGLKDEEIAELYSFAYHKFSSQKYQDAREMFKVLLSLDPYNPYYSTALGICHHRLKNYEYALPCYMLSYFLDQANPVNLFYAYDCYINLKDDVSAAIMLSNVIAKSGELSTYAQMKKKAEALFEVLHKKIEQERAGAPSSPK